MRHKRNRMWFSLLNLQLRRNPNRGKVWLSHTKKKKKKEKESERPVHLASWYSSAGASSIGVRSLARIYFARHEAERRPREFRSRETRGRFTRAYVHIEYTAWLAAVRCECCIKGGSILGLCAPRKTEQSRERPQKRRRERERKEKKRAPCRMLKKASSSLATF